MSRKTVDDVKKRDRGFRPLDIVVYAVIIIVVVALFLVIFLVRDRDEIAGFYIYYSNDEVFSYCFDDGECEADEDHIIIESDTDVEMTVRFFTTAGSPSSGYNIISVDKDARTVDVTGTDCSSHMECYYMDAIADTGTEIICSPHKMRIVPFGYEREPGTIVIG